MNVVFSRSLSEVSKKLNRGLYIMRSRTYRDAFRCGSRGRGGKSIKSFYHRQQECNNKRGTKWVAERRTWELVMIAEVPDNYSWENLYVMELSLHEIAKMFAHPHWGRCGDAPQGSKRTPIGYISLNPEGFIQTMIQKISQLELIRDN